MATWVADDRGHDVGSMDRSPLTPAELMDWELRHLADRHADSEELARRDTRFLHEQTGAEHALPDRDTLLRRWLRAHRDDLPGATWSRAWRSIAGAVWLLTFLSGLALAIAALAGSPVDLFFALGLLLGLQLVFLVLLMLSPLLGSAIGPLGEAMLGAVLRVPALRDWCQQNECQLADIRRALGRQLPVLRWHMLGLTQRAAVAMNLGMLLVLVARVTFSDLRLRWATSLPVSEQAARIHDWASLLAAPWAWAWPQAVPDQALVLGSLADSGPADPEGRWWPWLLMCLVVYGLLPRVLLAGIAGWRSRRLRRQWPAGDPRAQVLAQRLFEIYRGWNQAADDGGRRPTDAAAVARGSFASPETVRVLPWLRCPIDDDAIAPRVRRHFDAAVLAVQPVEDLLSAATAPADEEEIAWLLVVEDWQVPTKKCLRHLRDLRARTASDRLFIVALLGRAQDGAWQQADPERVRLWREYLSVVGDDALRVEALDDA